MSEQGSAAVSMRQLATACGLNAATLYHYFPSKADLLRSVIEERRYGDRLATDTPPVDPALPPRDRLVRLLSWLWARTLEEEQVFRLLVGESLRGDPTAKASTVSLVDALAGAIEAWLGDGFPELDGRVPAVARVVRSHIFALVVEHMTLGGVSLAAARRRAAELADLVFR